MKLNATTARTLHLPRGSTDKTYFDDALAGFGLRLRPPVRACGSCSTRCVVRPAA